MTGGWPGLTPRTWVSASPRPTVMSFRTPVQAWLESAPAQREQTVPGTVFQT